MALRDMTGIPYIPMLGVKPAETQALEELPDHDKQVMMPMFQLGPWSAAHHLQSAIARLEEAYGDLPCFVTLADVEPPNQERPVHRQLAELRNPAGGYNAWCQFIENKHQFVPSLQLAQPTELLAQAARLYSLGRGLSIVVERGGFPGLDLLSQSISGVTDGGRDVCFMLDLGRANRDVVMLTLELTTYFQRILSNMPQAYVAFSASSFPESFTSISSQEIYERVLFNSIQSYFGERLIFSDRGSARAERQGGGGGVPAPRIDYATPSKWTFYRSNDEDLERNVAYSQQAQQAMASADWDGDLRIWGTQMIERTALGDASAIISPKRCTAARINIHLHRQTHYGNSSMLYNTDDDWSD